MSMSPEERAVIRAAQRLVVRDCAERKTDLRVAVQRLKISRQPEHTVEAIPCMVYAPTSAGMFCVLPKGHGAPFESNGSGPNDHAGYPKGVRGAGPGGGMRVFRYSAYRDSMEGHDRVACDRFPGCERHP